MKKKHVGNKINHPLKSTCINGHDIAECGRYKNGVCISCAKYYNKIWNTEKHTVNPKKHKRVCIKGHDTFVVGGRTNKGRCKQCQRDRANRWVKDNPNLLKGRLGHWRFSGVLNIDGTQFDLEDFNIIFEQQKGKCKICGTHQSKLNKVLCADHDHKTGLFRGLLCWKCNLMLGRYENNKEKCEKYLIQHQKEKHRGSK